MPYMGGMSILHQIFASTEKREAKGSYGFGRSWFPKPLRCHDQQRQLPRASRTSDNTGTSLLARSPGWSVCCGHRGDWRGEPIFCGRDDKIQFYWCVQIRIFWNDVQLFIWYLITWFWRSIARLRYFRRFPLEQEGAEGLHCGLCKSNMTLDHFWKLTSSSIPATCSLKHASGRGILQQLKIPSFKFSHSWGLEMTNENNVFHQETTSSWRKHAASMTDHAKSRWNASGGISMVSQMMTRLRWSGRDGWNCWPLLGFQVQSFIVFQHTSSIHPKMGGISNILAQSKDMYDIYIYFLYYVYIFIYLFGPFPEAGPQTEANHFQPRSYGVFLLMFRCFDCSFRATVSSPYHPKHKFSENQEGHICLLYVIT